MLAARIGASFTAELGTMQVSEEIEAIESDGHRTASVLVAPRMLALFFLMPCLSTVSNISAIFASSLISKAYFSIAFPYFLDLVRDALLIRDLITGVFKSLMFGLLIAAIACYRGLSVKGGAAGVGTATTSSVVTAITVVNRRRYALQHRLRQFFPDMSVKNSPHGRIAGRGHAVRRKKSARWLLTFSRARGAPCDHGPKRQRQEHNSPADSGNIETY